MDTIINDLKEAPDVEVLTLKGASYCCAFQQYIQQQVTADSKGCRDTAQQGSTRVAVVYWGR